MSDDLITRLVTKYSEKVGLPIDFVSDLENFLKAISEDYEIVPKKILDQDYFRIAKDYAEELDPDNKVNREMIEIDSLGYLNWVLLNHAIVPISELKYQYFKADQKVKHSEVEDVDWFSAGKCRVLEEIFGEEMFKENKTNQDA